MTSPHDAASVLPLSDDEAELIELIRASDTDVAARASALSLLNRLLPEPVASRRQFNVWLAVSLGLVSGTLTRIPMLVESQLWDDTNFYAKYLGFLIVPFIALYFATINKLSLRWIAMLLGVPAVMALIVSFYRFEWSAASSQIIMLHLPVALLATVALALAGEAWRSVEARLRIIRFAAEWFVLFVLVVLGGGVLIGLFGTLANEIGSSIDPLMEWLTYLGPVGALVVTAALAASESRLVSGACQLLTKLFVPLFSVMLVGFLLLAVFNGLIFSFQRNLVLIFDVVLLVVTALTSYQIASRDPAAPRDWLDRMTLMLLVVASVIDSFALVLMLGRTVEIGLSINRSVAIGMNIVLLVNLIVSALILRRFIRGGADFHRLLKWQSAYLPVYFVWAAFAGLVLPPLFGFQ